MKDALFWLLAFCGFAAISFVCGVWAWPQLSSVWTSIQERIDRFRWLPPLAKLALIFFVGVFFVYGSTKTNQVGQTGLGLRSRSTMEDNILCSPSNFALTPPTVTPEDIARGWQLVEVRTNAAVDYAMPEGASLATNWWVRGAFEDVKPLDFGNWRFPFGTNEYDSAWAFSWGKLRFTLDDTNEIVAVGAPMSAVPYCSRLWTVADTNGARLVTWEGFVLGRRRLPAPVGENVDGTVNAQIELRANGDFVVRSNEVESVCRRIDPDDYDDDGWQNDDDGDPYCWDESWDDFWQELPEGANTNAYCWIEIRPRWHSYIEFVGDGPSDLTDPYLYGKAGKTYRVLLLIGKTYEVECTQPVDVVARSDARIEVTDVGPNSFVVVWPVVFEVGPGRAPESRPLLGATWNDGGSSFHVLPDPGTLGGEIVWYENCCPLRGDGINFTYTCDNSCTCEGCIAYGGYCYGGYELPVVGWPCGCSRVDDNGPFDVIDFRFDKSAAIYEDPYTNMPGVVVHPTPSNVVLRCEVYGGTYGGRLTVALNDAGLQKLRQVRGTPLPNNLQIPAGASRTYEVEFTPLEPSARVGDIVATMTFVEDFLNETHTATAAVTSVRLQLEAVYDAPENHNPSRHVYGVGEKVKLKHEPSDVSVDWLIGDSDFFSELEDGDGCDKVLRLHYLGGITTDLIVKYREVGYSPYVSLVEPQSIVCKRQAWDGDCAPKGQAGGVGMYLWLYVEPMHVSFQGIDVAEIPCANIVQPVGYYATTNFNGVLSHALDAGAGYWHHVREGNYWCQDQARSNIRRPEWSEGAMIWNIPIQWYQRLESSGSWPRGFIHADGRLIGGDEGAYLQLFNMSPDGTVKVTKHGHWVDRTTNDVIRLDGTVVHTGNH